MFTHGVGKWGVSYQPKNAPAHINKNSTTLKNASKCLFVYSTGPFQSGGLGEYPQWDGGVGWTEKGSIMRGRVDKKEEARGQEFII